MDAETRNALARLEERFGRLEMKTQDIRSRVARGRGDFDYIRVGPANAISPVGYNGIKKVGTTLSGIPDYDPATNPATIDGIGWGWHYRTQAWVLIIHDSTSGVSHDLVENSVIKVSSTPSTVSTVTTNSLVYVPLTV